MNSKLRLLAPALIAVAFAVATAISSALTDNQVTADEWVQVTIQGTTAVGVYVAPAIPSSIHAKVWIAATLAVLNLLVTLITDGLTGPEIVNLVVAGVGVLAVRFAPQPVHQGAAVEPTVVRA